MNLGYGSGASPKGALKKYYEIVARATRRIGRGSKLSLDTATEMQAAASEAGHYHAREVAPLIGQIRDMPLSEIAAATDADNAGTLAGTLVLQQSLPLYKYRFPILSKLYSDFSATPGVYKQTEDTRIIITPAVQSYDNTTGADGRPKGWQTVVAAQSTDVAVSLDEYIGVPIVFGAATVASTTRKLFDEQGPAAIYAIAKYFVAKATALMTPANFNFYAAANGSTVPDAYASYAVALKDFSMDAIDDIEATFDAAEVPESDRVVLLNAKYHGKLRKDPRLALFFAAMQKPDMVTEGSLPNLNGFLPIRAPWLPTTNNLTGFAGHKASIVLKQRLPTDFTKAIDTVVPGSVTSVTDPDSGLSIALVQYVNLTNSFAEWRAEDLLGAAKGDRRGGLCIVSG